MEIVFNVIVLNFTFSRSSLRKYDEQAECKYKHSDTVDGWWQDKFRGASES